MRSCLALLGLFLSLQSPAYAQNFPNKTVTLVVPFAAGGSSDIMGRAIGQKLSEMWKQPVIIDNRPGAQHDARHGLCRDAAGGWLHTAAGAAAFRHHAARLFELALQGAGGFPGGVVIAYYPLVTVVNPSLPVNNLKELFEYARAKPGTAYCFAGPGYVAASHVGIHGAGGEARDGACARIAAAARCSRISSPAGLRSIGADNRSAAADSRRHGSRRSRC